jgi:hypothetical protein
MKIAFLFLTRDDLNAPNLWTKFFYEHEDKVNIYCHPKNPSQVITPWLKRNIISNLVATEWGYIVNAYVELFKEACKNTENTKFIVISESCVPLYDFMTLYNFLLKDNVKTSYITYSHLSKYDLESRIQTQKNYDKLGIKFKKHYARFCLSRYHVQQLLKQMQLLDFFKKMHVGDEFFLSILTSKKYIKNYVFTFDNWRKTKEHVKKIKHQIYLLQENNGSNNEIEQLTQSWQNINKNPYTYNTIRQEDIDEAKNSGAFFWRKMAKEIDLTLIGGSLRKHTLIIADKDRNITYQEDSEIIDNISNAYNCRIPTNPPFFRKIIVLMKIINLYDAQRIYNMCLVNGIIYFEKQHIQLFETITSIKKENDTVYSCIRTNNTIYTFKKRVVEFIIMGFQRCGTTSLSSNLSRHPDLYIDSGTDPRTSEIHYYDLKWINGLDWYKNHFDYSKKLVGEKTPDLVNLPHTFPLIQKVNPFVKIIIILRNPVLRAYSAWKMISNYFGEKRTFENLIDNDIPQNKTFHTIVDQCIWRGFYYKHLKKLLRWFPIQNIHIMILEDVEKSPQGEYSKLFRFLCIDDVNLKLKVIHTSDDKSKISNELYNKLMKLYETDIAKLSKLLKREIIWR